MIEGEGRVAKPRRRCWDWDCVMATWKERVQVSWNRVEECGVVAKPADRRLRRLNKQKAKSGEGMKARRGGTQSGVRLLSQGKRGPRATEREVVGILSQGRR